MERLTSSASCYYDLNPIREPKTFLKAAEHHVIEVRCLGLDVVDHPDAVEKIQDMRNELADRRCQEPMLAVPG